MPGKHTASMLVITLILLTMVPTANCAEKTPPRPGSWSPLGGGLRGFELGTTSLCVYDGRLFAICELNDVVWDGTSWQPLDDQIDGLVSTLGIWKDSLVAVISWYDFFDEKTASCNGIVDTGKS